MASAEDQEGNDGKTVYQIEEVELRDIGQQLIELAGQLREAGEKISDRHILMPGVLYAKSEHVDMDELEVHMENADTAAAFRSTLTAMRHFRRDYERWERLTAEFALTQMGYSQRDAARALGVAASTINRWAQHPLTIEDYR